MARAKKTTKTKVEKVQKFVSFNVTICKIGNGYTVSASNEEDYFDAIYFADKAALAEGVGTIFANGIDSLK